MRSRSTTTRGLGLLLVLASLAFACLESATGRIATAAIAGREHRVSLRVSDGHVDLVLHHDAAHPEPVSHDDHVVHLCAAADAAATPRPQLAPAAPLLLALSAAVLPRPAAGSLGPCPRASRAFALAAPLRTVSLQL